VRILKVKCFVSMHRRLASGELRQIFFQPLDLHLQAADLLEEFLLAGGRRVACDRPRTGQPLLGVISAFEQRQLAPPVAKQKTRPRPTIDAGRKVGDRRRELRAPWLVELSARGAKKKFSPGA
jgi:hypothetical protein